MNLSGKEKAQLLLSVLGDQSKDILNKLSPEAAEMLMSEVGSAPKKDSSILSDLLREIETVVTPPAAPSTSSFKEVPSVESTQTAPSVDDELAPGDEDDSMADTEEEDDGIPRDKDGHVLREIPDIAQILTEQSPQVIAFVLSKIDDETKVKIMEYIPEFLAQELKALELDVLPIGDHVFQNLYKTIFLLPPDQPEEDEDDPLSLF